MQLPRYGAFDPVFPGEEYLSCSGRLLVSRGARQTLSIICADFGATDIVEGIGRKHGESIDAGGSFRFPYFEWKPWLKPVRAVALRLPGFIAMPSTA